MVLNPHPNNILCNAAVKTIKLIFYQNTNPLVLGLCIGNGTQREGFALSIPTCWYPKSLVDPTQSLADQMQSLTDPKEPQQLVEYSSHWVCDSLVHVCHVDFMLFVSISFVLGSQCKHGFW